MAQASTAGRPAAKPAQPKFEDQPFAVKLLVLVVLLGFIGAGYYFALHMSLADEISGAESQHAALINERAQAEQRQQEYLRLSQELAEREPIDRLNKRILPENAEIPAFLEDVNRVAELAGLQIRRVEPTEEVTEDKYVRIPISMEMEGRFHQFAKFFYNIGQLERAASMHIESIRHVSNSPGGQQLPTASGALPEVRLVVELEATAFRRPAAAAARTAAAPGATPTGGR
jgi:type IV pilus assembly protein PilO